MSKKYDFQYTVIGSGPAGSAAATTLAKSKKHVALVEGRFFGGSDLNTTDVPYAVALDFAHTYAKINSYPEFKNQDFSFNFPTVASHELQTIIKAGGNNRKVFEDIGITCFNGFANILDTHTIAINDKKITSSNFILATGAKLNTTNITGLETVKYLTPETAIKIHHLPKVIVVVGAGSTGCEIASYFAELGTKVILFEAEKRILPREDTEVSATITNYFSHKLGISVLYNCKVVALKQDSTGKYVIFRYGSTEKIVRVEQIVLATGSLPNLDCGLENARIKYTDSGITVNKYFETSAKNFHAIGDCIGGESSTDIAYQQGLTLATNIINKSKNLANYRGQIRLTNTPFQVATVGLNEEALTRRKRKYKKSIVNLQEITASKIYNLNYGFIKLLADKTNHIVGATIVSPHADLMIQEISLAIRHNHTAIELASTPHLTNGLSHAVKLAARQLLTKKR